MHSTNEKLKLLANCKKCQLKGELSSWNKNQPKPEYYSHFNNIELAIAFRTLNAIPENNLEKVVIDICHNSCLEIELKDINHCYCLPISRYSRISNKIVIINFVNRKHSEALLGNIKNISSKVQSQRGMDALNKQDKSPKQVQGYPQSFPKRKFSNNNNYR